MTKNFGSMGSDDSTRMHRADDGENYCPACDGSFGGELLHCPEDGTKLVRLHTAKDPLIGRNIDGRFVIKSRLGTGGMGAVYLAMQGSVGREVALKVIESRISAGKLAAKRFLREAKLSSRLSQPNTVTVLDFGQTDDGLLYLVMELVKGRTLGDVLSQDGRFTVDRMVKVGIQLCDALEAAHRLAIIHRDLKPSNVILLDDPPGRDHIKVLDFGLAKSLAGEEESTTMTQSDAIMGTPSYIPPEAVTTMQFDARSDLYSLGVILYELVAGELPFSGTTVQTMLRQHAYDAPKPLPPSVPPTVQTLLYRLLEKDPARRLQSAVEVRDALLGLASTIAPLGFSSGARLTGPDLAPGPRRAASAHEVFTTQLTPLPFPPRPRARRWPWLVLGLALLGVAVGAAVATDEASGPDGTEVTRGSSTGPGAPAGAATAPAVPTTPVESGGPAVGAASTQPSVPATDGSTQPTAPVVETVAIKLDASPPAIVWVGQHKLGRSPQVHRVTKGDQPLAVRFVRDGYRTLEFTVVPSVDREIERSLDRLVEARPAGRPSGKSTGTKTTGAKTPGGKPGESTRPTLPGWVRPGQ